MPTEIRMPMWGMGMLEGTVIEWYKHEGDEVDAGEPLAEIEAAKTTKDLVSPVTGILQRVLVGEDETVPVQELLAIVVTADDEPATARADDATAAPRVDVPSATAHSGAPPRPGTPARNVVPRARQRAKELGIDVGTVAGTGPGGRVTVADVELAANAAGAGTAGSAPAADAADGVRTLPLTGMRGIIARRMHDSLQSMAQLTLVTTADVTELVEHRSSWTSALRPTYSDYVVRAVVLALRDHERLNATVESDRIRLFEHVDIGIATALADGLVVPVLRAAETTSLDAVARASAALVEKVRTGSYGLDDISDATFTVTSLGGQGIDAFTPIINPPGVAILGVGRIVEQPVRAGDGIGWRHVMTLSLTIDHRAVDGAPGAAFLRALRELLADPDALSG